MRARIARFITSGRSSQKLEAKKIKKTKFHFWIFKKYKKRVGVEYNMSCDDVGILFFYSSGRNEKEEKKIKK